MWSMSRGLSGGGVAPASGMHRDLVQGGLFAVHIGCRTFECRILHVVYLSAQSHRVEGAAAVAMIG